MSVGDLTTLQQAARMLAVKSNLHLAYGAALQRRQYSRHRRREILSGSRKCPTCERLISGNKAYCRTCQEAQNGMV